MGIIKEKKEWIPAIEYMRGISMLGVVGIHVGSQYLTNNVTANLQLLALYEIITRFSVPIFFFISAFGLFYHLKIDEEFCYKSFMKRRFKTVMVPYLVWSALYILLYTVMNQTLYLLHPLNMAGILFFGLASYQLYFMVILIWFYLLMPLWIFMVRRMNAVWLAVLFAAQMAFNYYSSYIMNPYGIENEFIKAIFVYRLNYWVAHYVFIFILGGYLAVHYAAFKSFMQNHLPSIRLAALISMAALLGYYYYCIYVNGMNAEGAINTAHQLSPAGMFYTVGASIYLFAEFQYGILSRLGTKFFALMGRHSYFMYLAHPIAITIVTALMAKFNIVFTAAHSMIFYWCVIGLTLLAAIAVRTLGSSRWPLLNELTIGLYKKKKA